MDMRLDGTWSGLMLDTEGHQARAELGFGQQGGEIQGRVVFTLIKEDESREQTGTVTGKSDESGRIFLEIQIEQQEGRLLVSFEGRQTEVKHHARSAIIGTYQGRQERVETTSAGVAIFWLFAQ